MEYYLLDRSGNTEGPFPIEILKAKNVKSSDLVWADGMNEWVKAGTVDDLKNILISRPPPPPIKANEKNYFLNKNGEQEGPFCLEELASKNLKNSDYIWTEGMDKWVTAGTVKELKAILKCSPPPPPVDKQVVNSLVQTAENFISVKSKEFVSDILKNFTS